MDTPRNVKEKYRKMYSSSAGADDEYIFRFGRA
jgi:hypothetical protein